MDDLAALRLEPRDATLILRLGRRFAPTWGFVAYGGLYSCLALVVGMAALIGVAVAAGGEHLPRPAPIWFQMLIWGVGITAFAVSWLPFARWVKRRRGDAYRLFRHGRFVDATVTSGQNIVFRGAPLTRAKLSFAEAGRTREVVVSVAGHPPEIVVGAVVPVLIEPNCRYSAVFISGRAVAAR
jgi:hypothetical protein